MSDNDVSSLYWFGVILEALADDNPSPENIEIARDAARKGRNYIADEEMIDD